jgi:hypothetical protein
MSAARYAITDKNRAVELREAGWSLERICDLIEQERGHRPSKKTIWTWTYPAKAREQQLRSRARSRRRRAAGATFRWPNPRGPEWKVGRMHVLRDGGLSCAAIASVMTIDFPDTPLTEHQVRGAMTEGRMPRNLKAAA